MSDKPNSMTEAEIREAALSIACSAMERGASVDGAVEAVDRAFSGDSADERLAAMAYAAAYAQRVSEAALDVGGANPEAAAVRPLSEIVFDLIDGRQAAIPVTDARTVLRGLLEAITRIDAEVTRACGSREQGRIVMRAAIDHGIRLSGGMRAPAAGVADDAAGGDL